MTAPFSLLRFVTLLSTRSALNLTVGAAPLSADRPAAAPSPENRP